MLISRNDEVFRYADELHRGQTRKGKTIRYVSNLISVSAIAIEHGGTKGQANGALLHDAAEDQGGQETFDEIKKRFGDTAAEIVESLETALERFACVAAALGER